MVWWQVLLQRYLLGALITFIFFSFSNGVAVWREKVRGEFDVITLGLVFVILEMVFFVFSVFWFIVVPSYLRTKNFQVISTRQDP